MRHDPDHDAASEPDADDDDLHLVHRAFRRVVKAHGGLVHPSDLGPNNPAVSARQQRFMGAELARSRAGKATQTKMTTAQLEDFARKPKGGY